jgi:phosphatidylinositol 4-kinase
LDPCRFDPIILTENIIKVAKNSSALFIEKSEEIEEIVAGLGMTLKENGLFPPSSDERANEVREALAQYSIEQVNVLKTPLKASDISFHFFKRNPGQEPFESTLAFIEQLTEISNVIMRSGDKKTVLQKELMRVNQKLPACAYLPFSDSKIRNSFVLHIPVSEAKVFTTKERAPYLICLEVFSPYEEFKTESILKSRDRIHSRSFSETRQTYARSFAHPSSAYLESTLKETLSKIPIRAPTMSVIIQSTRPSSLSVSDIHYSDFPRNSAVGSLAAVYEADDDSKSEDVIKSFQSQAERIRKASPFGSLKTWALVHVIVKSGDDLRQEQLAMQLISFFLQTFKEKKLKLWLYPYDIIATGPECGILECVPDAISIDALKKATQRKSLFEHFVQMYGGDDSRRFKRAQKCFMRSLAGYSLLCYILQIKDRHNGNILIDRDGHLIHIDFGFMLSNAPGKGVKFEKAPFKLTEEWENLLGGRRSHLFQKFRSLCVKGYVALKEKAEQINLMVEMMRTGSGASLGCFSAGEQATSMLRDRLNHQRGVNDREYINQLIDQSLDNWTTRCYDRFQYCCQNIY